MVINKNQTPTLKFPNKFRWGTATAAFQIEGHPEETLGKLSDWSEWLEREDKVRKPTNDGNAVNHYEHMMEDVELIRGLNNNSYRFSFNWARLHRGPGQFDENTARFYDSLLDQLLQDKVGLKNATRIEPFATIVHFAIPTWLAKQGGWENPVTAHEFQKFTEFLVKRYGSRIKFWMTHNEPNIFLGFGYESGIWPPGYCNDWNRYFAAYQGLLLSHQLAYKTIKDHNPSAQVGFAQNLYYYESPDPIDRMPNALRKQLHNYAFIESCLEMNTLDFLGINYYTRFSYKLNPKAKDPANPNLDASFWGELIQPEARSSKFEASNNSNLEPRTSNSVCKNGLGWEIYPEGLYKVLTDKKLSRMLESRPIYITENGYSHIEQGQLDIEDSYRVRFIRDHLIAIHKAINEGANVKGYFHWSLLDNFEWALGMNPRFGLVHVDHSSFVRTKKLSYDYYSNISLNNGIIISDHNQQYAG